MRVLQVSLAFWRPAEPFPKTTDDTLSPRRSKEAPPPRRSTDVPPPRRSTDALPTHRSADGVGRRSADGGGGGLLRLPAADPLGQAATLMRLLAPDAWASRGPGQEYTVSLTRAVPFVIE